MLIQDLKTFKLPKNFRGKNAFIVQLWWLVQSILFRTSPQFLYGWRNFLLRLFGAKIGKKVIIRPSVKITYPWKLSIGNYSWIGDDVDLYTLGKIDIGNHVVISQRSYLCTGSHDYNQADFAIYQKPIKIHDQVWIATDVFIAPGVTIHEGSLVGVRSSVFTNIPSNKICVGTPAKIIRERIRE
jgi:putative colanic acid biosynthesis acetyltransferase WcaF